jgi:type II secretory pathway pseudopilin PulG
VVIAIIALLIAILLPALGKAREAGKMVKEQALGHQQVAAMAAYYTDSKDKIMPAAPHWAWDHAPPNVYSIFPADPLDRTRILEGSCTKVWGLYFIGYTNWPLAALMIDKTTYLDFLGRPGTGYANGNFWQYGDNEMPVAFAWHPSLGMNGTYIGGAYPFGGFRGQGPGRNSNEPWGDPEPTGNPRTCGGQFYARQAGDVRMPSNIVFFGSARGGDVSGTTYWGYGDTLPDNANVKPGYWIITSPKPCPRHRWVGTVPTPPAINWTLGGGIGDSQGWSVSNTFDPSQAPSTWGMMDFRWSKKAVTAQFDGSVKNQGIDDLRDMTKWSNVADGPNWTFPTTFGQIMW